jgi:PHD/YefM family antitoxin component YafN of YafNO toxin-antitoxin module
MGRAREQYIIDENGRKTAVVLSMRDYRRLMEEVHDLAVVAERRGEPAISLEELKRRLRADGLLQD